MTVTLMLHVLTSTTVSNVYVMMDILALGPSAVMSMNAKEPIHVIPMPAVLISADPTHVAATMGTVILLRITLGVSAQMLTNVPDPTHVMLMPTVAITTVPTHAPARIISLAMEMNALVCTNIFTNISVIYVFSVAPILCDACTTDADCGPFNDYYMTCDPTRGKCICGASWSDTDGDATNGCEAYTAGTPITDTCPMDPDCDPGADTASQFRVWENVGFTFDIHWINADRTKDWSVESCMQLCADYGPDCNGFILEYNTYCWLKAYPTNYDYSPYSASGQFTTGMRCNYWPTDESTGEYLTPYREPDSITNVVGGDHGACPFGYSYVENTCWKMTITENWNINFQAAEDACATDGGFVAIPRSEAMTEWIVAEAIDREPGSWTTLWVGITNHDGDATYETVDGSALSYTNWWPGEPNHNADCVIIGAYDTTPDVNHGKWFDTGCSEVKPGYICEVARKYRYLSAAGNIYHLIQFCSVPKRSYRRIAFWNRKKSGIDGNRNNICVFSDSSCK